MQNLLRPATDWELARLLADATAAGTPVEVFGGRSKTGYGRPTSQNLAVSTDVLRRMHSYNPREPILTAEAGCLVSEVERELANHGAMLGFEPLDVAGLFGGEAGRSTIGGLVATNLAGCRRLAAGDVRDNLLGIRLVNGKGEIVQAGGPLERASTGIDLRRILAGSWGTLGVIVEVSLRVARQPEETTTAIVLDLAEEIAIEALSDVSRAPLDLSAAIHLEAALARRLWLEPLARTNQAVTAIRLEGTAASNSERLESLRELLKPYGKIELLDHEASLAFWHEMRQLSVLQASDRPLWRVLTRPSAAFDIVSGIRRYMPADAYYDWSGGLIWLEVPHAADAGATEIRRVLATAGGEATLVRASDEQRRDIDVFQPMEHGIELMTRRVKQVFDPGGILNPGRMYATL